MFSTFRRIVSFALCLWLLAPVTGAWAVADRIELVNGSVIIGQFLDADGGKVTIETDFAGVISIEQARIIAMDVRAPLTLQFRDGSVLDSARLQVNEQTVELDYRSQASYALDELMRINPEPWELGKGYRNQGTASSAFLMQRGNTVLDELDYRVQSRWTGLEDRFTLKLEGELRETNRERVAENWMVTGKYDRFQVGDYYLGLAGSVEEDRFADLDLRTRIGPYIGRRFLELVPFTLELETGLSQVYERYGNAANRDYVGLTWSLRTESDYFGNDSRLYVDQTGVRNIADRSSTIVDTTVGLSFPLIGALQGSTEIVLNYNSDAVENVEKLDQTYRFRIGYSW